MSENVSSHLPENWRSLPIAEKIKLIRPENQAVAEALLDALLGLQPGTVPAYEQSAV